MERVKDIMTASCPKCMCSGHPVYTAEGLWLDGRLRQLPQLADARFLKRKSHNEDAGAGKAVHRSLNGVPMYSMSPANGDPAEAAAPLINSSWPC